MTAAWIALEGTANTRDLGGLRLVGGGHTQRGRLIRSDNLQDLSPADVDLLIRDLGVCAVADLRTEVEILGEGPGPLVLSEMVEVRPFSLLPAMEVEISSTTAPARLLQWHVAESRLKHELEHPYLSYVTNRPDSVISALRLVAHSSGATVVHCAAGKDRTGVVVAMALEEVGVVRDDVVTDYAASGQRIGAVVERLRLSRVYSLSMDGPDGQFLPVRGSRPSAGSMRRFLEVLDTRGGVSGWLRTHGWSVEDAHALRRKLVDSN